MSADKDPPKAAPDAPAPKDKPADEIPPAGPHARPDLLNPDSTPGSGMLPSDDPEEGSNAGATG